MVPLESLGSVSYLHSIVIMAVSLAISDIFNVINALTLKSWFGVVQGHWKYCRSTDIYDFLLVGHCDYSSTLYSLNFSETGTIRKLECSFLFVFYSNYGAILYRLRDIATYWSKIAKYLYAPVFSALAGDDPVGISWTCLMLIKLDAGMWRYHANRMDARRSQFDLGRVVAYI